MEIAQCDQECILFLDINECTLGIAQCDQECILFLDINECTLGIAQCDQECILFLDINECTLGIAQCGQECINTAGSFFCTCSQGFKLRADQRACDGEENITMVLF